MKNYNNFNNDSKMKFSFEIHTTASKPIIMSFDNDLPMKYCYNALIQEIEYCTVLTEDVIIDIFAEDLLSNKVISLSTRDDCNIEEFIISNRGFFPSSPVTKNLYKVFVIDKSYLTRRKNNSNELTNTDIGKEVQSNQWNDLTRIINDTKSLIYF
jgi:hypothetical protein